MKYEFKIYLAILNITSWVGQCGDAKHVYGHLILSEEENVNIDNVEDFNVKYLGDKIELRQPLTLELAKQLDKKECFNTSANKRTKIMNTEELLTEEKCKQFSIPVVSNHLSDVPNGKIQIRMKMLQNFKKAAKHILNIPVIIHSFFVPKYTQDWIDNKDQQYWEIKCYKNKNIHIQ